MVYDMEYWREKNAQGSNESLCSRKMVVFASFSDDS